MLFQSEYFLALTLWSMSCSDDLHYIVLINWITATRKSGKHYARHMEPLDSCLDLIRSHELLKQWFLPLDIEPATTEYRAET